MPVLSQKARWLFHGLLAALAIYLAFTNTNISFAGPPLQGGTQPQFTASSFNAANGSATIQLQETTLDQAYFASNGSLEDLAVSAAGLTLTEGSTSGTYLSAIVQAPLASTTDIVPLWQTTLPEGSRVIVETRMQTNGGGWSDWTENPEAFYPVRNDERSGNMIWVGGGSVDLQFRVTLQRDTVAVTPIFSSLTLVFNDTTQGPTDATIASQMQVANHDTHTCPVPKPYVVSRTEWGCPDGQDSPWRPPQYAPVTHIIIHHTATSNYPYQDWASVVRSVWNYHTNVLWWGDVGYNYLIDPNGVIYEGRAGGDDVIGIHDTHNRGSMAIGFIGCYGNCGGLGISNAHPAGPMLESARQLMAWKLDQKGINPLALDTYDGLPYIPVIAGGRDVTATYSPGDNLYHQLPNLRSDVHQRIEVCQIPTDPTPTPYDPTPTPYYPTPTPHYPTPTPYYPTPTPYYPTPTPHYPTPTPHYPTPTPTPYIPPPNGVLVKVNPDYQQTNVCAGTQTTAITALNVADLTAISVVAHYDPQVIQLIDADVNQPGVQVRPGSGFTNNPSFIVENMVDTNTGRIAFAVALIGSSPIAGDADLLTFDWQPKNAGSAHITLGPVDLASQSGQAIPHSLQNGLVEVQANCQAGVSGQVMLQGRSDYSGIIISGVNGGQTQTDADGFFNLHGAGTVTISYPGYLAARTNPITTNDTASATNLGTITLLAGDLNQDNQINIFDLAHIASRMQTNDPLSDLNADGKVDIFDLTLVAGNYEKQGPTTDWQQ